MDACFPSPHFSLALKVTGRRGLPVAVGLRPPRGNAGPTRGRDLRDLPTFSESLSAEPWGTSLCATCRLTCDLATPIFSPSCRGAQTEHTPGQRERPRATASCPSPHWAGLIGASSDTGATTLSVSEALGTSCQIHTCVDDVCGPFSTVCR